MTKGGIFDSESLSSLRPGVPKLLIASSAPKTACSNEAGACEDPLLLPNLYS